MKSQLSIAALKAVALCASTEATRYYLNGVFVNIESRATVYVATDGHRMLVHRAELPAHEADNKMLGECIIPLASIAKLKPVSKYTDSLEFTQLADGKYLLGDSVVTPIDGTFPDWRRVIPAPLSPGDSVSRAQFNLAYLHDFQKAGKILGGHLPHIHYSSDERNPCAVTFGDLGTPMTFGVIMPYRNAAPLWAGLPDWAQMPAPKPLAIAAE